MARPRSEDKRNGILSAAAEVFAERGLGAPTSAISRAAAVAEGTLFTYFKTKDELINMLYRQIKLELADAIMSAFPRRQSVRVRIQHIWNGYVNWGVANPVYRKLLGRLEVSDYLTPESEVIGAMPFAEVQTLVEDAAAQHLFQEFPVELVAAAMRSLSETTMELTEANPESAEQYRDSGFRIFWTGVTRAR